MPRFQFTPVVRRATKSSPLFTILVCFNSRPSCDGRRRASRRCSGTRWFQFTPVVRRATHTKPRTMQCSVFQFTPVVRRATIPLKSELPSRDVSIHARRATGDRATLRHLHRYARFNSRPSCDGRPPDPTGIDGGGGVSIHARRATGDREMYHDVFVAKVSIHARRATGDGPDGLSTKTWSVSIHARRATGDY